MISTLLNRAKMIVSGAPGTGPITLGSAVAGFQSFAGAGALDGQFISYLIVDGSNWEYGQGPYTSVGTTLTRTTILGSSNGGAAISATANALVSATALASDLNAWNLSPSDNRIINGDMRIDQRNNGASGVANGYTVDRWAYGATVTAKGTWGRGATGLAAFPYSLAFTSSSAYTLAAGDGFAFLQPIEADFISDFAWGTASAQPVTLSFLAYSSLTGTFGGSVLNYAQTRSYVFSYSIPIANTWTKIVLTIPGDTGGSWVMSGNGGGLYLRFDLGSGTTYRGSAGAWSSACYLGATGAVNVVATNAATFYVTGVKLEVGSIATPFNRQSLAKCQVDCERYFRWLPFHLAFYAPVASAQLETAIAFAPAMRAAPTASGPIADPNITQVTVNNGASGLASITAYGATQFLTAIVLGNCYVTGYRFSLSAEL